MTAFQLTLLPGLLQSAPYRRWIASTTDPTMSAVDVERRLELTARRQRRIREAPGFSLNVMLSEATLRHQVGGPEVMREQLHHLASVSELPNVSLRVIPFGAGPHFGLVAQSFTLFEFPPLRPGRPPEPAVVFVEGFTGALFLEDNETIARHREAIAGIREVTLEEDDTRSLMQEIAEEHGT